MHETILLADDDPVIVDILSDQLQQEGFQVLTAADGEAALHLALTANPDLVLLDVMMPKRQGWEVCQEIRRHSTTPIVMLTARGAEVDRVLGLELGADDYVVKPFSFRELLARIRANLRRVAFHEKAASPNPEAAWISIQHVAIHPVRRDVTKGGELVHLSYREHALLLALVEARGAVVKRSDLLNQVWGAEWVGDPRTLDVHIRWLREKLEDNPSRPQLLLTVRNLGYRLVHTP
ncbi:MAG: response regulator transcription factor [Caldilineaceae bacterium]|nr:response regulator transcription factor [Caldilineaceae bacterium]